MRNDAEACVTYIVHKSWYSNAVSACVLIICSSFVAT
jgi:hypothetical protein